MAAGQPGKMAQRDVPEQLLNGPFTTFSAIQITVKLKIL